MCLLTENSFELYDYEQAQKSYRIWQANECEDIDDYLMRQRKADLNQLVKKVIENEFDDHDRMLVKLNWYQGIPKEEIAKLMGMSRSAVFRRLNKIIDILYDKLKYAIEYRYGSKNLAASPVLIKDCAADISGGKLNDIGGRLKNLRTTQYLTVSDVTETTGISQRRLADLENNKAEITALELKKLALFYKVQTDYIIFGPRRILRDPLTGLPINHNCEK